MYEITLFYTSTLLGIICPIWIAIELYIWSNFIKYITKTFYNILIGVCISYAIINIGILIYGSQGDVGFGYIDYNAIPLIKTYIHAMIPLGLSIILRVVNHRVKHANPTVQNLIQKAFTALSHSEKQSETLDEIIAKVDAKINR